MKRSAFENIARTLSTLTLADLEQAAHQESHNEKITNHAVNTLRRHSRATATHVMGSDASRQQIRSQIWLTIAYLNAPSVWLTVNPDDLHDPIAQVFMGEDIDLDKFDAALGPDKATRACNIARDPCAASEFFKFTVDTMLEKLLQVSYVRTDNIIVMPTYNYVDPCVKEWAY